MRIKLILLLAALALTLSSCSVEVGYQPMISQPTVSLHSSEAGAPQPADGMTEQEPSEESGNETIEPLHGSEADATHPAGGAAEKEPSAESGSEPSESLHSSEADATQPAGGGKKPSAESGSEPAPDKASFASSSSPPAKPKPQVKQSPSAPEVKSETSNRTVEEGFLSDIEDKVFELINEERIENGIDELEYDYDLLDGARIRSKEMFVNNYFAHARPDGSHWSTVFDVDLGILTVWRGENLAMVSVKGGGLAHQTARYWVQSWINSPDHYANMLKREYTHAAIGIYYHYDGETYYAYATNLFASY